MGGLSSDSVPGHDDDDDDVDDGDGDGGDVDDDDDDNDDDAYNHRSETVCDASDAYNGVIFSHHHEYENHHVKDLQFYGMIMI